jgi:hypothetical protein
VPAVAPFDEARARAVEKFMALDPLTPLRLGFRIGIGVVRFELRIVEHLLGLDREEPVIVDPEPSTFAPTPMPRRDAPQPVPEPVPVPEPEPEAPSRPRPMAPAPPEPQPEPQPEPEPEPAAHLDTEPELVAEFAEPGAEEGAGAELRVAEPWDGYRKARVAEIRDRVAAAGAEELAVIQLYEMTHRKRRSVLDAVERRTKQLADAPARS